MSTAHVLTPVRTSVRARGPGEHGPDSGRVCVHTTPHGPQPRRRWAWRGRGHDAVSASTHGPPPQLSRTLAVPPDAMWGVGGARCRRPESAWAADTQAGLTRSPVLVIGVSLAARSHCTHELCAVRGEERGGDSALGRHAGVRTRVPGRAGVVPPTLPSGGRVHCARCAPATSELPEDEAPGPPPERWQGGGSRRCSGERPWFPCGTACARPGCSTAGFGPQAMP